MSRFPGRASLVLLILALVGPMTPSSAGDAAVLAGLTRVQAEGSAWMRVEVPADTYFSWVVESNPQIDLDASDGFAAVVLTADVPALDGPTLLISGVPDDALCSPQECLAGGTPLSGREVGPLTVVQSRLLTRIDPQDGTGWYASALPAGSYLMYVITESRPVEVTLRLPGLEGEVDLHPTDPVAPVLTHPEPHSLVAGGHAMSWVTASTDLGPDARGLAFAVMWVQAFVEMNGQYAYCTWEGEDQPEDSVTPICLGGSLHFSNDPLPSKRTLFGGFIQSDLAGRVHQKLSFITSSVVERIGSVMVWLPFGSATQPMSSWSLGTAHCLWVTDPFEQSNGFECVLYTKDFYSESAEEPAARGIGLLQSSVREWLPARSQDPGGPSA